MGCDSAFLLNWFMSSMRFPNFPTHHSAAFEKSGLKSPRDGAGEFYTENHGFVESWIGSSTRISWKGAVQLVVFYFIKGSPFKRFAFWIWRKISGDFGSFEAFHGAFRGKVGEISYVWKLESSLILVLAGIVGGPPPKNVSFFARARF